MRCLITGGAGFIGSNLADQLVKLGHNVHILDNLSLGKLSNLEQIQNKIQFNKVNICENEKELEKYFSNIDWVFHLAGLVNTEESIRNPKDFFNTNVNGTKNILKAAKNANVKKFIYSASASCYGEVKKYPINENVETDPKNPYAETKLIGEQQVINWSKNFSPPAVSLRFFNVYGPRSISKKGYGAVFSIFLSQKISKEPLTIVGDGNQTRDFVYVNDVVEAMISAAKSKRESSIYNVGTGKEVTINKIANIIGGKKVFLPKRPQEIERSVADISKIKSELDWKPKIQIEEGLKILLNNINT